jgi:hypothetical protein
MTQQTQAIFRKKRRTGRNPEAVQPLLTEEPALHDAKAELPTFYAFFDFFLIRLRQR